MNRLRSGTKLVAINLFLFLVIIWSLNSIAALLGDAKFLWREWLAPVEEKAKQASLRDRDHAALVFREFSLLRTRYEPYVAWSRAPFRGEATTVDQAGDRIHQSHTDDPVGHVRFFGGSTMWGKGVDDDNTIPAHFEALHPGYRAHNHGESGFVSRQEVARLINLVNQREAMDLVVFYDGCNDAFTLCRSDISINGHRSEAKIKAKMAPRSRTLDSLTGELMRAATNVSNKFGLSTTPLSRCEAESTYARRVAQTMVSNWAIAKLVAESAGAEFHAILQPIATFGDPNLEYLPGQRSSPRARDYQSVYPHVREIVAAEQTDWMHDMTDAFDRDDYIYIDGCHVNNLGNEIIARRIDALVGERLRRADSPIVRQPE